MVKPPPAVVIAATASGSGKTTVATGLIGALRRAGHRVAPFKVGPDYIDPGYHSIASGMLGRNLDPVLVGSEQVPALFAYGTRAADLAVVEGVMGLFDGKITEEVDMQASSSAQGSTAAVAVSLGAPVILVVDARGQSQSLAAVLHGFSTFDPEVRIGGVILNQVGSPRHEWVLRQACERVGIPVFGALPRQDALVVPSRHLGLIPAVEHGASAISAVSAMTELVARYVDIAAIVRMAASSVQGASWDPVSAIGGMKTLTAPVVAIAGGAAFTFGYAEHIELLRAAGAQVVVFDPLTEALPESSSGLVLPGGFPEEHAAGLSSNSVLLKQVKKLSDSGAPIHAECAGLLYLAKNLDGHPMSGVLDIEATFGARLTLGYRDAVALTDSSLFTAGTRITGHEFHRTTIGSVVTNREKADTKKCDIAWGWRLHGGVNQQEGFVRGGIHASYLHTHPVAYPEAVARFVRFAAQLPYAVT
ncbi:MAG: cobyrinate a,c-diamide synthase [Mycobacteriaceae bacterium]